MKSLQTDSRTDSTKHMNNNLESTVKAHVGKKSEQINQVLIPLSVRQSWLAMNDGFSMSDVQMETKNLPSFKS